MDRRGEVVEGARRARGSDVDSLVRSLRADAELRDRIVHWRTLAAREASTEPLPESLDPRLAQLLRDRGLERLYVHQRQAILLALAGRDVLVTTPTASGKTLCYTVP